MPSFNDITIQCEIYFVKTQIEIYIPKNEDKKKDKIKKRLIHIECREINDWFNLIACNIVLLSTLQEQVQYKEHIITLDKDVSIRIPRSASMSNIATVVQAAIKHVVDPHHDSFFRQVSHSPPTHQLSDRIGFHFRRRSPSPNNLNSKCPISIEDLNDNIVPQSSHSTSSMTINGSTRIGEILFSYLPYMVDAYFQYCNGRSIANKYLQSKSDLNKRFRTSLEIFQDKNDGLSLNGFLTKPIQRVTRYPFIRY